MSIRSVPINYKIKYVSNPIFLLALPSSLSFVLICSLTLSEGRTSEGLHPHCRCYCGDRTCNFITIDYIYIYIYNHLGIQH